MQARHKHIRKVLSHLLELLNTRDVQRFTKEAQNSWPYYGTASQHLWMGLWTYLELTKVSAVQNFLRHPRQVVESATNCQQKVITWLGANIVLQNWSSTVTNKEQLQEHGLVMAMDMTTKLEQAAKAAATQGKISVSCWWYNMLIR